MREKTKSNKIVADKIADGSANKAHLSRPKKIILLVVFLLFLTAILILIISHEKPEVDSKTNKIYYPEHRAPPQYSITKINESEKYSTFKVVYTSDKFMGQGGNVYGLLYVPKTNLSLMSGIVFLPGGGVTKEDEPAAKALVSLDYVVLVIDQRGIGETGGIYPSYEQDKLIFENKKESIQHLGVYDALRAVDVLRDLDYVDKNNLLIGGASMGGRYAIIAAALDSNIKKAIIISSSGFHIENTQYKKDAYFLSIDPDRYIKSISPNKLVMIHSTADTMISIEDAKYTFSLADEPKSFYTVENCTHGYCDAMLPYIKQELAENN